MLSILIHSGQRARLLRHGLSLANEAGLIVSYLVCNPGVLTTASEVCLPSHVVLSGVMRCK